MSDTNPKEFLKGRIQNLATHSDGELDFS